VEQYCEWISGTLPAPAPKQGKPGGPRWTISSMQAISSVSTAVPEQETKLPGEIQGRFPKGDKPYPAARVRTIFRFRSS
jgi:hypothetical protein